MTKAKLYDECGDRVTTVKEHIRTVEKAEKTEKPIREPRQKFSNMRIDEMYSKLGVM